MKGGTKIPTDFRGVFADFIFRESSAAASRVDAAPLTALSRPERWALREAIRCDAAAAAVVAAVSVPGADRLNGAPSHEVALERARLMESTREMVEAKIGVSALTGKKLSAGEIERRRRAAPDTAKLAAAQIVRRPLDATPVQMVRTWMVGAQVRAPQSVSDHR